MLKVHVFTANYGLASRLKGEDRTEEYIMSTNPKLTKESAQAVKKSKSIGTDFCLIIKRPAACAIPTRPLKVDQPVRLALVWLFLCFG